jgi:hypothetical protein
MATCLNTAFRIPVRATVPTASAGQLLLSTLEEHGLVATPTFTRVVEAGRACLELTAARVRMASSPTSPSTWDAAMPPAWPCR